MTNQNEDKPKKSKGFKIVLMLFAIIEIGLIATGLSFIISSFATTNFEISFERFNIGIILIWIFMGSIIIFFPILLISFIMSKRKELTKTFHNISSSVSSASAAASAPYSASYRPSKSGKVYYCDYCGYEVKNEERECPECSGPIKRGKRVA